MSNPPKRYFYHIILANHGKQQKDLFYAPNEIVVNKEFKRMLKENEKVVFPIRWNNEKHVMVESEHELIIIKYKDVDESNVSKLRNDSGEFINYQTNSENWIIYDRAPYKIEETFWVYGYHPKLQRKDFNWIFDNFIEKGSEDKYMFKTVQVFKNKLLVDCNGKLEMVICKNRSDSARMYNLIEKFVSKKKYKKNILFMGDLERSRYKEDWVQRIQDLTHWSKKKIGRASTRP